MNITAMLDQLGIDYRVYGDEAKAECPGHLENTGSVDRNPSWSVNVNTGQHYCFSCGFGGSFVYLVEYLHGDATAARKWLREEGVLAEARAILSGKNKEEEENPVTEAYLAQFTHVPDEVAATRRISPDSCDHYGVLWNPKDELWITPVREPYTHRLLGWQEKNKRYFNNYPPNMKKSKTLFGFNEARGDTAVLVESPLDVLRLHSSGLDPIGVSSYGVRVSQEQIRLIMERFEFVVVALDNDRDGHQMSGQLQKEFGHRIRVRFWNYDRTSAKDPGEQTDSEIWWSYKNAYSTIYARF